MAVILKFGGDKNVDIDDLPLSVIEKVEVETGRSWWDIAAHPFATAGQTSALFNAVAENYGYSVPELTMGNFADYVDVTPKEDDRPTEYQDGLPLTEGESPQTS